MLKLKRLLHFSRDDINISRPPFSTRLEIPMAASSGSPPQRPREPAWKRLGLKLKYAKEHCEPRSLEVPQPAKTSETSTANSTNRQSANDSLSPSKKRKTNDSVANDAESSVATSVAVSSESQQLQDEQDTAPDAKPTVGKHDHDLQLMIQ